jgi:6-phosphogluconate dehydrogenase
MQIGIVGLGRMGTGIVRRLIAAGHEVVATDIDAAAREAARSHGAQAAEDLAALVAALRPPRALWVMVPAGEPTDQTFAALGDALAAGDTAIDGGNSRYDSSMRRGAELAGRGIHFLDVGTSGGIHGFERGFNLSIGGDPAVVARLQPIFAALAGDGWTRVGPVGAGHFVKMIHNGIEYGMMQAYAEGFAILAAKGDLALDLAAIARLWNQGSVIRSWLLELIGDSLAENPGLPEVAPQVADAGEGRGTVAEALALDVPAPVITHSLIARLRSRDRRSFADRVLAALRNKFGGHAVTRDE